MTWKQRATDNFNRFASGSAFDLATIVGSLSELNAVKPLSPRDRDVLDKARKNLICEISEVMGETKGEAEQQINEALGAAKNRSSDSQKSRGSKLSRVRRSLSPASRPQRIT